ncbi:HAD family hydrolase [Hymenobacter jeollabukensis]|uniref:HAD family hydrolase n=1 Tax=Hymenobacter jeollabukensis TaxID=2025313 RepID=A0A5R8WUP6_9BACT|nr:HAD family hydrolase [Hymenobacter jeollabukensis]TLM95491.1 HAD family hydrolase [Hymenobacter jeollabukensis]
MPLTTVLFDLDDTLFDHAGTARAALEASTAPFAWAETVELNELYQRYSDILEEMHPRVLAGEFGYEEARRLRFQRLLAPYQAFADDAEADAFAAFHYGHYRRLRRPVAGAAPLLEALKPTYRIGIVTNNRTEEQVDKLAFLGLTHLVDALITSEAVGVTKPDPRIFRVALAQLGARPEETVLVGDNWTADVLGARAAGIRPVWLNRFGAECPEAGVTTITGFEPLAQVLPLIIGAGE